MLCVNHSHASVPRSAEGRNPVTWVRNCSNVKSSTETPKTAKSLGSRFAFTKLKSAGISLRFVRSPAAPKRTITHGPAGLPVWSNALARFAVFAVAMGYFVARLLELYSNHLASIVGHRSSDS